MLRLWPASCWLALGSTCIGLGALLEGMRLAALGLTANVPAFAALLPRRHGRAGLEVEPEADGLAVLAARALSLQISGHPGVSSLVRLVLVLLLLGIAHPVAVLLPAALLLAATAAGVTS